MKEFRGTKCIGWRLIEDKDDKRFIKKINNMMDNYDFIDCQFSTHCDRSTYKTVYEALILIGNKDED